MATCSVLLDFGYGNSIRFPAKTVGVTPFESFTDGTMKVLDVQRQIPLTNPPSSEPFIQGQVYRFTEPNGDTLFKTIPALTTAVYADIVAMFPVPSDSPLLIDALVDAAVVGDDLIVEHLDGHTTNAGNVRGPLGNTGPTGADGSNVLPTDTAIANAVNTSGSDTNVALAGKYVSAFTPESYGTCPGDGTDVTAFVNAAITAAQAAGGGTVLLKQGKTYTCAGAIVFNRTGTTAQPVQKPVRITSPGGASSNGYWAATARNGGAVLDLRYDGTDTLYVAKIDTRGAGTLEIDHINIVSGGSDDFPILQTTNTAVQVHHNFVSGNPGKVGAGCKQDAFILGGTSNTVGDGSDAPFQGYGSHVHTNFFDHIRRGFVGRTYCNSVVFTTNTISTTCGNDGTGAGNLGGAYELHGGSSANLCIGNTERDNTIEVVNYKYAVALDNADNNTIGPSGYWDASTGYDSAVYCTSTAEFNTITDGYHTSTFPFVSGPGKLTNTIHTASQSRLSFHPQPNVFRRGPIAVGQSGTGFTNMSPAGDAARVLTVAGLAGNPSYPAVELQTAAAKSVADVVTTSGSTVITSATAAWVREHEYMPIKGAGIPDNTLISRWISATSVELANAATVTATGVTVQYGHPEGEASVSVEIGFSRRHILSKGAIGTATGLAAAGYATAAAVGTDTAFQLSITCGATPVAGDIAVIGAGINWDAVPRYVIVPRTAAAAAVAASVYLPTKNTNANTYITSAVPLTVGALYVWDFVGIA